MKLNTHKYNMPKSRLRGGKKAHRKRVEKRNNKLRQDEKAIMHLRRQIYEEAKARYEAEQSGNTNNTQWNIS
jgi:hypothetical protein